MKRKRLEEQNYSNAIRKMKLTVHSQPMHSMSTFKTNEKKYINAIEPDTG
jgi:hypothetical protein